MLIGKRPFIVIDVFTECKKKNIEDRVEGGKNLYRGSLQEKGINHMEIKEKLKENTEFTCGENIKSISLQATRLRQCPCRASSNIH